MKRCAPPALVVAQLLAVAPVAVAEPAPPARPPATITPIPPFAEPELPTLPPVPSPRGFSHYTDRRPYRRPSLRVALGASLRAAGGKPVAAYTMDFMVGGHFGLHRGRAQIGLLPEAGYSFRTGALEHQLSAGLGLGWGMGMENHTVAIVPRFVLDPSRGTLGLGVRTGVIWHFAENGFSAEAAHQYVQKAGVAVHDVRLTVGVDLALLAMVLGGANGL